MLKSLAGWTYDFYNYYVENITMYLDNPYLQVMMNIIDPYGIKLIIFNLKFWFCLVYFDRYHHTGIFQIQAADDEFFLPDSEVIFLVYI